MNAGIARIVPPSPYTKPQAGSPQSAVSISPFPCGSRRGRANAQIPEDRVQILSIQLPVAVDVPVGRVVNAIAIDIRVGPGATRLSMFRMATRRTSSRFPESG
jgi:hypothetical protein